MQLARDIHYIVCFDFKFYQLYIVWIGDEIDGVLVNDDLKIIAFKTEGDLLQYWHDNINESYTEVTNYKAYEIQQWISNTDPKFDYGEFLNFWNLFTDIAASIKLQFIGDVRDDIRNGIYNKLFNASNGYWANEPTPIFDQAEIHVLNKIMQSGLDLLLDNIAVIENKIILP